MAKEYLYYIQWVPHSFGISYPCEYKDPFTSEKEAEKFCENLKVANPANEFKVVSRIK